MNYIYFWLLITAILYTVFAIIEISGVFIVKGVKKTIIDDNINNFDLFVCACVPAVGLVWVVGLAVAAKTITQNWKVLVGIVTFTFLTFLSFYFPLRIVNSHLFLEESRCLQYVDPNQQGECYQLGTGYRLQMAGALTCPPLLFFGGILGAYRAHELRRNRRFSVLL